MKNLLSLAILLSPLGTASLSLASSDALGMDQKYVAFRLTFKDLVDEGECWNMIASNTALYEQVQIYYYFNHYIIFNHDFLFENVDENAFTEKNLREKINLMLGPKMRDKKYRYSIMPTQHTIFEDVEPVQPGSNIVLRSSTSEEEAIKQENCLYHIELYDGLQDSLVESLAFIEQELSSPTLLENLWNITRLKKYQRLQKVISGLIKNNEDRFGVATSSLQELTQLDKTLKSLYFHKYKVRPDSHAMRAMSSSIEPRQVESIDMLLSMNILLNLCALLGYDALKESKKMGILNVTSLLVTLPKNQCINTNNRLYLLLLMKKLGIGGQVGYANGIRGEGEFDDANFSMFDLTEMATSFGVYLKYYSLGFRMNFFIHPTKMLRLLKKMICLNCTNFVPSMIMGETALDLALLAHRRYRKTSQTNELSPYVRKVGSMRSHITTVRMDLKNGDIDKHFPKSWSDIDVTREICWLILDYAYEPENTSAVEVKNVYRYPIVGIGIALISAAICTTKMYKYCLRVWS